MENKLTDLNGEIAFATAMDRLDDELDVSTVDDLEQLRNLWPESSVGNQEIVRSWTGLKFCGLLIHNALSPITIRENCEMRDCKNLLRSQPPPNYTPVTSHRTFSMR